MFCKGPLKSDLWQKLNRLPLRLTAGRLWLILALLLISSCTKPPGPVAFEDANYWTCSMHPSIRAVSAGKCPICGMDLVRVTRPKEESFKSGDFMVSVERQQQIGVTYAEVRRRPIYFDIRAVGMLEADQTLAFECSSRVDGYIEQLQITSPGERVTVGQPLM